MAPTLETERLILRPPVLADREAHIAAWADPRMTAFIGGQPRGRTESWGKFLQGAGMWAVLGYGYWSFIDRRSGAFLGNGGLAQLERGIPELEGIPEAGWALIPDAWGRGLASEAVCAITRWADRALEGIEIRCIIDPGNAPSVRVAEKAGFVRLGLVRFGEEETQLFARQHQAARRIASPSGATSPSTSS